MFHKILEENKIVAGDIESVRFLGEPSLDTPAFTNRELNSTIDVQFGPANVFSLVANGVAPGADWANLDIVRSPKIQDLAKKITYGAHSGFALRHGAGPFAAGGAMFAEHTADAARALMAQVEHMRAEPIKAEELADAKENAKLALPARFEGVDELTGVLADMAIYNLPLDEFAQRAARIDAVTAADVQRVAKKWLHPEAMRIVIAGDRAKVEQGLVDLGAIETRDAFGDLVK